MLTFCLVGCRRGAPSEAEKALATPVVPEGFNEKQLATLACPENGSALRFATRGELDDLNIRIGAAKLKRWNGEAQTDLVEALLIRADGKIAYRLDGVVPVLDILEALVLDDRVGHPKHKK
jgi:hypothetical protein